MNSTKSIHNYCILDFETSGLNFRTDYIIEACVLRVRDGEVTTVFNSMVQLPEGVKLDPKITEITGHTQEDVDAGITQESLAYMLWRLIGDDTIVAHNATFDLSFLETLFIEHIFAEDYRLTNPFIDSLTISRDRSAYPHKLGAMCNKYGIELGDNAHSAYFDCLALLDLMKAFTTEDQKKGMTWTKTWLYVKDYINVAGYSRKYGEPDWITPHTVLKPQGKETITHTTKKAPIIKSRPVITTTNKKKKLPTTTPEDVQKSIDNLLPDKVLLNALDALIMGEIKAKPGIFPSVAVQEAEFKQAWHYLTKTKGIPEHLLETDFDGEAIITYLVDHDDPFASDGRPIDISDDDLPF